MANITGLITVNSKDVLEVDADPSAGGGTAAARGSLAMFDTGSVGKLYLKTGTADTAWSEMDAATGDDWLTTGNTLTGGSSSTPNEFFGSNNDYDVKFIRNGIEQYRLQALAFLIGLNASVGGRLQVKAAVLGDEVFKQISPAASGADIAYVTRQHKVLTTDATLTTIATLAIPVSSQVFANYTIIGNRTGGVSGTDGDGAIYERTFRAKRASAGGASVSKYQTDFTSEDQGGFDTSSSASGNNVLTQVKGATDNNMSWVAHAKIMIGTT